MLSPSNFTQFTVTQTTANRELEGNATHFLSLLGEKRFKRMIDPFCGSASLSCHAMKIGLAKEYIINDAYMPIIALLKTIKDNPEQLKELYKTLINNTETLFSYEDFSSYADQLTRNNNLLSQKAAYWLFLANRLENNRPIFSGTKLISLINKQSTASCFNIFSKIDAAHSLFKQHTTSFLNLNAKELFHRLGTLNEEDLVFLDPPYPNFANTDKNIFFRPDSDDELYQNLMEILVLLTKMKVAFIFNYDLFFGKEKPHHVRYLIDTQDIIPLQHLILVSRNPNDPEFNILFEHIYISNNISLDMNTLPKDFLPYESIQNFSYAEAKQFITSVTNNAALAP